MRYYNMQSNITEPLISLTSPESLIRKFIGMALCFFTGMYECEHTIPHIIPVTLYLDSHKICSLRITIFVYAV